MERSRGYAKRSAVSVDGFHLRQYALLRDQALTVVSFLFAIMETMATLPEQLRLVMLAMLPKPTG
eukprot:244689-Pyramimonas_sp.AAC.1